jgi:hypothetical protein
MHTPRRARALPRQALQGWVGRQRREALISAEARGPTALQASTKTTGRPARGRQGRDARPDRRAALEFCVGRSERVQRLAPHALSESESVLAARDAVPTPNTQRWCSRSLKPSGQTQNTQRTSRLSSRPGPAQPACQCAEGGPADAERGRRARPRAPNQGRPAARAGLWRFRAGRPAPAVGQGRGDSKASPSPRSARQSRSTASCARGAGGARFGRGTLGARRSPPLPRQAPAHLPNGRRRGEAARNRARLRSAGATPARGPRPGRRPFPHAAGPSLPRPNRVP